MKNAAKNGYPDYGKKEYVDVLGEWAQERGVRRGEVDEIKALYKKNPAKGLALYTTVCEAAKKRVLTQEEEGDEE